MKGIAALLVSATALAAACTHPAAPQVAIAPPRTGDCRMCHAQIANEHEGSFHAVAFTDATFQESLALEEPNEHAFCTNCHAPAGKLAGVGCVSCHEKPHETKPDATCVSCHEFAFDDGRAELVQKTVSEHRVSAFADTACPSCHMSKHDGHADHRFSAGHDPSRIAHAVRVTAARAGGGVAFTIRADVGHAFPTGDMFRRVRLEVFADGADGAIVADAERTFGRTWTSVPDGGHAGRRTEARDTRIRGSWSETLELANPSSPPVRVRWRLLFERVIAVHGPHARVASSDVITEGALDY